MFLESGTLKIESQIILGAIKQKGLNGIAKIGYGYRCLGVILKIKFVLHSGISVDSWYVIGYFLMNTWNVLLNDLSLTKHWQEDFEDTKGVFRIHKSKKDRQHNGQKKKDNVT